MEIKNKIVDDNIILYLSGRIDANNANEVSDAISKIEIGDYDLVLDVDDLEYISSAGLRIVLKLLKDNPDLVITNANNDIYSIFEMTGFTEMMPVKKALRRMSVEGCTEIGRGAKGAVYRINEDTIIKVYNRPDTLPDALRERELARKAFVLGIPTAISYDVVRVGETYGSVFELLSAKSYSELIKEDPDNYEKYVKDAALLLKQIHETKVNKDDMPRCKEKVVGWLTRCKEVLDSDNYNKLEKLINDTEERPNMLHFDYHTNNIMMQGNETMLIDMDTLCYGHPTFELANIYDAYVAFGEIDKTIVEKFFGLSYDICVKVYDSFLKYYLGREDIEEVSNKVKLMGYVRFLSHTLKRDKDEKAVNLCKEKIAELLGKVNSLDF